MYSLKCSTKHILKLDNTDILIKVRKIVRSINLESKRIQKDHGVSIPQILCLDFLKKSDNFQATQKEIRDFLNLNSSTVTGIIDRLAKKGYLARLPKKEDRRTTYISLTSQGENLLKKIPPLLHDRLTKKLEDLPENNVSEINSALDLIIKYLGIEYVEASPLISYEDDLTAKNNF